MENTNNIEGDGLLALKKLLIYNKKAIFLLGQLNENINALKEIGIIVKYKCDASQFEENRKLPLHV